MGVTGFDINEFIDIMPQDFSFQTLQGVDLTGQDLSDANFFKSVLILLNFSSVNVDATDFLF